MLDLGDGSSIARTQFLEGDQILTAQIETKLQTDFQGIRAIRIGRSPRSWQILIGGIGGGFGRGIEGETFDILALERPGFKLVGHGEPSEENGKGEGIRGEKEERGRWRGEKRKKKERKKRMKMRGEMRWGEVGGYWAYIYLDSISIYINYIICKYINI